jgi:hypothetical protein
MRKHRRYERTRGTDIDREQLTQTDQDNEFDTEGVGSRDDDGGMEVGTDRGKRREECKCQLSVGVV